jgi:hypothetical protein
MSFFGKSSIDKAIDVVGDVTKTGLSMWDSSDFTPQEKAAHQLKLLEATKSQGTSISRRDLLWFIIAMTGISLVLALTYSAFGMGDKVDDVIALMEVFKIGWAFVATVSFYFLTQFKAK